MIHELDFQTSYRQFYLSDKDIELQTDSPTFWSKAALASGLALERGVIGVGIASYGRVRLSIETFESEPPILDFEKWDKITEGSIKIKSGCLQILDCPNSDIQLEINVSKGDNRVRIYGANFKTVVGDDGDDFYRIEIWGTAHSERKVLKK